WPSSRTSAIPARGTAIGRRALETIPADVTDLWRCQCCIEQCTLVQQSVIALLRRGITDFDTKCEIPIRDTVDAGRVRRNVPVLLAVEVEPQIGIVRNAGNVIPRPCAVERRGDRRIEGTASKRCDVEEEVIAGICAKLPTVLRCAIIIEEVLTARGE